MQAGRFIEAKKSWAKSYGHYEGRRVLRAWEWGQLMQGSSGESISESLIFNGVMVDRDLRLY